MEIINNSPPNLRKQKKKRKGITSPWIGEISNVVNITPSWSSATSARVVWMYKLRGTEGWEWLSGQSTCCYSCLRTWAPISSIHRKARYKGKPMSPQNWLGRRRQGSLANQSIKNNKFQGQWEIPPQKDSAEIITDISTPSFQASMCACVQT